MISKEIDAIENLCEMNHEILKENQNELQTIRNKNNHVQLL